MYHQTDDLLSDSGSTCWARPTGAVTLSSLSARKEEDVNLKLIGAVDQGTSSTRFLVSYR